MGQRPNHQDLGFQRRERAQGQAVRRYITALAASVALLCTASAAQDTTPKFDAAKAWDYLVKQVAFGPRKPGTQPHRDCRDYIADEMKKSCTNVSLQGFSHFWTYTNDTVPMWNIIGEQDYKDAPVKVDLYAHWDTRPFADQESERSRKLTPIPGADDGASGVAVLLQLMKDLKGKHPGIGIRYVMLDGEDLGPGEEEMYLGAVVYAKRLQAPKPDYGILLDMIGGKNLRVPEEVNSTYGAPKLIKLLYAHAAKIGLGSTFPATQGMVIDDDHLPIIRAGVPTVDLIDLTYPQWHTLDDTAENCSPESLDKVGKLLVSWLTSKDAAKAAAKG